MQKSKRKLLKIYIACIIAGLLLVFVHISARNIMDQALLSDKIKMLSDAFFMPSVLIFGFGILTWIASEGQFDVFAFGFKQLSDVLFNRKRQDRHAKDFVEFRQDGEKKYKEKFDMEGKTYIPLIVVGLIFFLISLSFNLVFESMI